MLALKPNVFFMDFPFDGSIQLFFQKTGNETIIEQEMLGSLRKKDDSLFDFKIYESQWRVYGTQSWPFIRTLIHTFKYSFIFCFFLGFTSSVIQLATPILIHQIISYVENRETNVGPLVLFYQAFILIVAIVAVKMVICVSQTQTAYYFTFLGLRLANTINMALYQKVFRFSLLNSKTFRIGQLVNFMQIDSQRIYSLQEYLSQVIFIPVQVGLGIYIMYKLLGEASIIGILVIVVALLINYVLGKINMVLQRKVMEKKDRRMRITNEFLNGIKVIKVFNWQDFFQEQVTYLTVFFEFLCQIKVRRYSELKQILWQGLVACLITGILLMIANLVLAITFAFYTLYFKKVMTASAVFTILATFSVLRRSMKQLPSALIYIFQTWVSIQRMQKFIMEKEIMIDCIKSEPQKASELNFGEDILSIQNGTFYWDYSNQQEEEKKKKEQEEKEEKKQKQQKRSSQQVPLLELTIQSRKQEELVPALNQEDENSKLTKIEELEIKNDELKILNDVRIRLPKGKIVAIIGSIGSGKSSLIEAILGEMKYQQDCIPEVRIKGKTCYVSQKPWILNGTVKENIIFGKKYKEERFQEVVRYAALESDMDIFDNGENSMIGENGLNISGGQKTRINIARALYSDRDIVLLDDPLSAVDVHVGKYLVQECFLKYLRSKSILIITHALQYLKYFDYIYLLENGRIVHEGKYKQIKKCDHFKFFQKQLKNEQQERQNEQEQAQRQQKQKAEKLQQFYKKKLQKIDQASFSEPEAIDKRTFKHKPYKQSQSQSQSQQQSLLPIKQYSNIVEDDPFKQFQTPEYSDIGSPKDEMCRISGFTQEVEKVYHLHEIKSETENEDKYTVSRGQNQLQYSQESISEEPSEEEQDEESPIQLSEAGKKQQTGVIESPSSGKKKKKPAGLIIEEDRQKGKITSKTYLTYIKYMGGWWYVALIVVIKGVFILLTILQNLWLTQWTNDSPKQSEQAHYADIFFLYILLQLILAFIRAFALFLGNLWNSKQTHERMIKCFAEAPLNEFFDRVPTGRILNRMSKDMNILDLDLYGTLGNFLVNFANCLSDLIFCVYASSTWALIPVFLFIVLCIYLQSRFLNVYRELVRLESITRSPIVSGFKELLMGITQIRAYKKKNAFFKKNAKVMNENKKNRIAQIALQMWFQQSLYIASFIVNISSVILSIFISFQNPAMTGLLLTNAFSLDNDIFTTIKRYGVLEGKLISEERCLSYTRIKPEMGLNPELYLNRRLPAVWPSKGQIKFKNYYVKYRNDLNYVLENINLTIFPGEKVGVVGRTGAGKSTIINSILRMMEADSGKIEIDEINIAHVPLSTLRKSITVILQDPYLFEGTVRLNIDPLKQFDEAKIIKTLEMLQIHELFDLTEGLDTRISENGDNLSIGQKQLLCIARAILKKSRIIFIDEATANIDIKTEAVIQAALETVFKSCTVVTIAHRMNTIMSSDRILVMENAKVVEDGKPATLLQKPQSFLKDLWTEASKDFLL